VIVFMVLAAVLAAACVAVVAVPLLKPVSSQARAPWTALAATVVLLAGSAGLYLTWSNWSWRQSPGVQSPEGMVVQLVHELNDHPDNLAGWLMLGRSYTMLEEYPLAVRAYERADRVAGGRSAEALVGEADALTMMDSSALNGEAGRLIERALAIDPTSPQALFFGAAAALRRGELPLARQRFTRLLALHPPASVKAILEQEIAGIDRTLAGGTPAAGPADPSPKNP
jgi:cytochrome c-type biogenesis protein CcmH